jgi:hypothetical protein
VAVPCCSADCGCTFSTVDRRTVLELQVDRGGTITDVKVARAMVRIGRMDPPPEPDLFTAEVVRLPFALTLQRSLAAGKCSNPQ